MLRSFFTRLWTARHLGGGKLRIAVALVMVVGASALFWTSRDYTVVAPEWDGQVRGIAYSPSRLFTERQSKKVPAERIDRDLAQLSKLTGRIRTYTVDGGMDKVPEIARRYGMTVSLGIWISADLEKNDAEIELGIRTALALSFILLVSSELIVAQKGFGFLIGSFGANGSYDAMYAVVLTVAFMGFAADRLYLLITRWTFAWRM